MLLLIFSNLFFHSLSRIVLQDLDPISEFLVADATAATLRAYEAISKLYTDKISSSVDFLSFYFCSLPYSP
jgi:hypothetical protein